MAERYVADEATVRLINWVLGVGSIVTGALLVWIGAQTFQMAQTQAVMTERLTTIASQQAGNMRSANETASAIRDLGYRVSQIEQRMDRAERIERERDR